MSEKYPHPVAERRDYPHHGKPIDSGFMATMRDSLELYGVEPVFRGARKVLQDLMQEVT